MVIRAPRRAGRPDATSGQGGFKARIAALGLNRRRPCHPGRQQGAVGGTSLTLITCGPRLRIGGVAGIKCGRQDRSDYGLKERAAYGRSLGRCFKKRGRHQDRRRRGTKKLKDGTGRSKRGLLKGRGIQLLAVHSAHGEPDAGKAEHVLGGGERDSRGADL